jgi:hypothetical protein
MRDIFIPLFAGLARSAAGSAIRDSAALIALTETIHLLGLTILLGTILMIDVTLLGLGFHRHPASRVARELAPWTTAGLVVMLVSGPFILSSEALKCFEASFFWIKMIFLFVAIVFHFAVHRPVAQADPPVRPWMAKLTAGLSLVLWFGVAISGKMVGIYGDDLRREPAPFLVHRLSPPVRPELDYVGVSEPGWRLIVPELHVKALPDHGLWNVAAAYVSGPRKLRIEATGTWGIASDSLWGPDGDRFSSDAVDRCLSTIVPRGTLIAKIGGGTSDRSGAIYPVGSMCTIDLPDPAVPNTTPLRGTLFLAMNNEPGKFGRHYGHLVVKIWDAS